MDAVLSGSPDQVGRARRLVQGFILDGRLGADPDVAVLLTSEIVTNAFRYGTGPFRLNVDTIDGSLCIEVSDAGGAGRPTVRGAGLEDIGGRGLAMVEALADDWGWRPGVDGVGGTVVWFRLALER